MRLRREVDPHLARALAEIFEITAEAFLQPRARPAPKASKLDFTYRKCFFEDLPFWDMKKREWIRLDHMNDSGELKKAAFQFFGVRSAALLQAEAENTIISKEAVTPADLAWICQVRKIARMMPATPFSAENAEAERENWIALRRHRSPLSHITGLLRTLGIRFLIVEALAGSRIDSAGMWLSGTEPVIALTLQNHSIEEIPWLVYEHLRHIPNQNSDLRTKITKSPDAGKAANGATGHADSEICQPEPRERYSKFKARVSKIRHFSRNNSIVVDGWGRKFFAEELLLNSW